MRAKLGPGLFGWSLFLLLSVSSCKNHSATSPQLEKSAQPAVQPSVQTPVETEQEKSCREFVQSFYDGYFDRLNRVSKETNAPSPIDGVLQRKPMILTVQLMRLLREDAQAATKSKGELVGLDFDPFINAQDWDAKYRVESVSLKGATCRAAVWGMDSGAKREMVDPELEFDNGKWTFINFHYPGSSNPNDENLIGYLIMLRNDRSRSKK